MRWLVYLLALCLAGTVGAQNPSPQPLLTRGEVLRYNVWWGPLQVGSATLTYTPQGLPGTADFGYVLEARVQDSTPLLTLVNTWRAQGVHSAKVPFSSRRYEALQQENDYRADKLVTFNPAKRQITYLNRRDATDTTPPIPWRPGRATSLRDAFSTVYAWRALGTPALATSATQKVMGLKRPFVLTRSAAVSDSLTFRNQRVPANRVDLTMADTDGTAYKDTWRIWLSNDATLTPLKIQASNTFGTFTARLAK